MNEPDETISTSEMISHLNSLIQYLKEKEKIAHDEEKLPDTFIP
jgi:hypothetical protein